MPDGVLMRKNFCDVLPRQIQDSVTATVLTRAVGIHFQHPNAAFDCHCLQDSNKLSPSCIIPPNPLLPKGRTKGRMVLASPLMFKFSTAIKSYNLVSQLAILY